MSHITVVFVCTGNTCRSPLAMALARCFWHADVAFFSAGLRTKGGQPASDAALAVAGEQNLALTDHQSRAIDNALLVQADWLIGMTRSHVAALKDLLEKTRSSKTCPAMKDKIRIGLLGHANQDLSACQIPEAEEIADPFGSDLDVYRTTAHQIARLLRSWEPTFTGVREGQA